MRNDNEVYYTTKEGLEKMKEELKERETTIKERITNTLSECRSQGDLRENDGYSMAIENQNINEERIMELKNKIKNAVVIKDKKKSVVGLGDTVTLKGDKKVKYEITSEEEANPLEGKVSHSSPVGLAVMGKKVGDKITINTPAGTKEYTLEAIA